MKKIIFLLFFISANCFASVGKFTTADGVKLYSEYYPNLTSKFKGTIIFINGSGTSMGEWGQNKQFFQCAKNTGPLFLWDRSGLGVSPENVKLSEKHPITAKLISNQLTLLLKNRHIPSPYIIVAHSYGSIYAGYFVLKHPKLVKALLLVDPVPSDFKFSNQLMKPFENGITYTRKYPENMVYKKYGGADTEVFYQMIGFSESKNEIKRLGKIKNSIPVVIISSTKMEFKTKPIVGDWYNQQKQWLNENSNSKIFRVTSGHFIQIHRPSVVCDQIRSLIKIISKEGN